MTQGAGKAPNNAIIKLIARNGTMLSCGCDPPVRPKAPGSILESGGLVLSNWPSDEFAHTVPTGLALVPAADWASGTWEWSGIWLVVSVTVSCPPAWARTN